MDEISKDMGITYSVMTADIDEKPIRHEASAATIAYRVGSSLALA